MPTVARALGTLMVARLTGPAAGLAVVLLAVSRTDSFAAAGLLSGVWVSGTGVGGFLWSRLVDRGSARLVLCGTAVGSFFGLLALAAVPTSSVPALVGLTAAAALLAPPVIPTGRALWPVLLPDEESRSAMYSLEATLQELTFIVGPALAGGTAALASPAVSIVVIGAAGMLGCLAFTTTPGLDRLAQRDAAGIRRADVVALAPLLVTGTLLVTALSITEVSVVGAASRAGSANSAGLLLAVWSAGSLVGGLVAGARPPRHGPGGRLVRLLGAVAISTAMLAATGNLLLLGVLLVVGGALVAPALGSLYTLVGQRAPAGGVTQTFAALTMFALAGAAAGSTAGGALVQTAGPDLAFLVGALAPVVAALVIAGTVRRPVPRRRPATADRWPPEPRAAA
jgi:MFS family permease